MSQSEPENRSFKKDEEVASFKATETSLYMIHMTFPFPIMTLMASEVILEPDCSH